MNFAHLPVALRELLDTDALPELGPEPRQGALSVAELEPRLARALETSQVPSASRELVRGAVLLWHDHLEESHAIAQDIHNADGSFLHAIMHRREPDAGNSQYWWHRVGTHPCFAELGRRAKAFLEGCDQSALATRLTPKGTWDTFAFVEECERTRRKGSDPERTLCRELQRLECEVFLEHLLGAR
jgi:hypothetical protein